MSNLAFIPSSEDNLANIAEPIADWQYPLDLNRVLLPRPASTFLLRADANRHGVRRGDIVIVDRSLTPGRGSLVVAVAENELQITKLPAPEVWGVITHIIRSVA